MSGKLRLSGLVISRSSPPPIYTHPLSLCRPGVLLLLAPRRFPRFQLPKDQRRLIREQYRLIKQGRVKIVTAATGVEKLICDYHPLIIDGVEKKVGRASKDMQAAWSLPPLPASPNAFVGASNVCVTNYGSIWASKRG